MVSQLDTRLIEKFLNLNISKEDLRKFDEQEKREIIAELTDLRNLRNQSESEIYKVFDLMFSNNQ
jgi:phage-related protein